MLSHKRNSQGIFTGIEEDSDPKSTSPTVQLFAKNKAVSTEDVHHARRQSADVIGGGGFWQQRRESLALALRLTHMLSAGDRAQRSNSASSMLRKRTSGTNDPTVSIFMVEVQLLRDDQAPFQIEVHIGALGQWLFNEVIIRLGGVLEREYFGLRYLDKTKQRQWLDLSKPAYKQLKQDMEENDSYPKTLSFRVKHYPASPLEEFKTENSRYLLYLQLRRDLHSGRLVGRNSDMHIIAAHILQAEIGDYDKLTDLLSANGNLGDLEMFVNMTTRIEAKIREMHQSLTGLSASDAEQLFLKHVSHFDTYGVEPVFVQDRKGDGFYAGLSHEGVTTFSDSRKVHVFAWSKINKISHDGKLFIIQVEWEQRKHMLGFKCQTSQAAEALWKWAIDRQCFFTLSRSIDAKESKSSGSLFKKRQYHTFTGRCQKELMQQLNSHGPQVPRFEVKRSKSLLNMAMKVGSCRSSQEHLKRRSSADMKASDIKSNFNEKITSHQSIPDRMNQSSNYLQDQSFKMINVQYSNSSIPDGLDEQHRPSSTQQDFEIAKLNSVNAHELPHSCSLPESFIDDKRDLDRNFEQTYSPQNSNAINKNSSATQSPSSTSYRTTTATIDDKSLSPVKVPRLPQANKSGYMGPRENVQLDTAEIVPNPSRSGVQEDSHLDPPDSHRRTGSASATSRRSSGTLATVSSQSAQCDSPLTNQETMPRISNGFPEEVVNLKSETDHYPDMIYKNAQNINKPPTVITENQNFMPVMNARIETTEIKPKPRTTLSVETKDLILNGQNYFGSESSSLNQIKPPQFPEAILNRRPLAVDQSFLMNYGYSLYPKSSSTVFRKVSPEPPVNSDPSQTFRSKYLHFTPNALRTAGTEYKSNPYSSNHNFDKQSTQSSKFPFGTAESSNESLDCGGRIFAYPSAQFGTATRIHNPWDPPKITSNSSNNPIYDNVFYPSLSLKEYPESATNIGLRKNIRTSTNQAGYSDPNHFYSDTVYIPPRNGTNTSLWKSTISRGQNSEYESSTRLPMDSWNLQQSPTHQNSTVRFDTLYTTHRTPRTKILHESSIGEPRNSSYHSKQQFTDEEFQQPSYSFSQPVYATRSEWRTARTCEDSNGEFKQQFIDNEIDCKHMQNHREGGNGRRTLQFNGTHDSSRGEGFPLPTPSPRLRNRIQYFDKQATDGRMGNFSHHIEL